MKGFPNQVANLGKLSAAMKVILDLQDQGRNVASNEVLGEALVRGGVAGTGHSPMPVDEYLSLQRKKEIADRSHHTTARGPVSYTHLTLPTN